MKIQLSSRFFQIEKHCIFERSGKSSTNQVDFKVQHVTDGMYHLRYALLIHFEVFITLMQFHF